MANITVIAMGMTVLLVIVTMVTNVVIGNSMMGSVDTQMKNTMANVTVIAMVMISLLVIVTLVTNVVIVNL